MASGEILTGGIGPGVPPSRLAGGLQVRIIDLEEAVARKERVLAVVREIAALSSSSGISRPPSSEYWDRILAVLAQEDEQ